MAYLVTGFPTNALAASVVRRLLEDPTVPQVWSVVPSIHRQRAEAFRDQLPQNLRSKLSCLDGDPSFLDLGLSGAEHRMLASEVTHIHHFAGVTSWTAPREAALRANVRSTAEVVELAEDARGLDQLVLWSSALVSGNRTGIVMEDDLEHGGFRGALDESRARAEWIVREVRANVPTTVLRPAWSSGDSRTGEIDMKTGLALLIKLMLGAPRDFRLPASGRGFLNVVPLDYVVSAGLTLARHKDSLGRTYHIVDGDPFPMQRAFEVLARECGLPPPVDVLPPGLAAALLGAPGLDRLIQVPRALLDEFGSDVSWNDRRARPILDAANVQCPSLDSYAGRLVAYVKDRAARQADADFGFARGDDDLPVG